VNNATLIDAGAIVALVTIIVGLIGMFISPDAPRRDAILRTSSCVLGVVFAVAEVVVAPGTHTNQDLLLAGEAGLALGATVTIAVAGIKSKSSTSNVVPAVAPQQQQAAGTIPLPVAAVPYTHTVTSNVDPTIPAGTITNI
jgi:hypothetical protein